ncbi:MFS transporter [Singulisphaera acidiphila]|uniref:Arabinose efflux permease family protein n=1 Tax=Singulisphaera acidiphila (strain ATCC BAA-1392 / DSM 18658 / VKM B-2454 / MOB10) TaxID=886293 RepID=L0DMB1_SINAD|nr:MFS transporter [Singulisphaera acidiphila]AGA29950.1 arabinose efflux permease family protein [Singulisphaera acidiphila DSM 18658]
MAATNPPGSNSPGRNPSPMSLRALDGLNIFLADVRDGMGPFLGTFLRDYHHWDAGRVGIALAASQIGTVLAQTPAGALIDRIHWKRLAIAIAAAVVAACCVLLYVLPTLGVVVLAQAAIGAAAAIFPPAVGALTLGLVGRAAMPRRTGRNEAFNHGGNVVAAALAGGAAYLFGYGALFFIVAAMAAASAAAVLMIREKEIDHDLARGADDGDKAHGAVGITELFKDRRIMIFAASVVLFHLANAAMLPLVGQKSSDSLKESAAVLMSACIIAAQVVMVPVALAASRLAESWGRKPVFLIGFGVLPIRGLLYCLSVNPYYLVGVQLLDGIGAGIFGVVSVLVVADLTKGTGRFNLTQGALATATGVGAGLSNLLAGFMVKAAGFNAGFVMLAAIAGAATLFFALAMPETLRSKPRTPPQGGEVIPAPAITASS